MPIRLFRAIAAAAMGCWMMTGVALADGKVALVIGNAGYQKSPLANPINDAKLVAQALGEAGFQVQLVTDLTQAGMRRALRDFTETVTQKGKDTIALVYYAGHGLQIDGENFLVPVDAKVEREADVAVETMRLADMMNALAALPTSLRIVILDACRNNPFDAIQKTTGKGLAIVDAPAGSIVAYATAPGSEALDGGRAGNSPYTAALVEVMRQPNLQIEQMFKSVRVKVNALTGGKQVPWETSSLTVDFAFFGKAPVQVAVAAPAPAPAAPAAPAAEGEQPAAPAAPVTVAATDFSAISKARVETIKALPAEKAYDVVIEENTVEAYEEFIRVYPEDPRCRQIRILLNRRNQMVAWRNAVVSNTPESYEAYEDLYPESDHVAMARRLRIQPRLRPIDPVIARPIHHHISRAVKIGGNGGSLGILSGGSRPVLGGPGRPIGVGNPGGRPIGVGNPGGRPIGVGNPGQGNGGPKIGLPGSPGQGGAPKVGIPGNPQGGAPKVGVPGTPGQGGAPKVGGLPGTPGQGGAPKVGGLPGTPGQGGAPKVGTTGVGNPATTTRLPTTVPTVPRIQTTTTPTVPRIQTTVPTAPRIQTAPVAPRIQTAPVAPRVLSAPTAPRIQSAPVAPRIQSAPVAPRTFSAPSAPRFTAPAGGGARGGGGGGGGGGRGGRR